MTQLQCSAVHCEYNRQNCCCRPDIQVGGGHNAKSSGDTCCDSFHEKSQGATNAVQSGCTCHPDASLKVGCTATSCIYNQDAACTAKAIQIGNSQACQKQDTMCTTFSCGCR